MLQVAIFEQHNLFKDGYENLEDDECAVRSKNSIAPVNVKKICEYLKEMFRKI